jgi:hypothetical protein
MLSPFAIDFHPLTLSAHHDLGMLSLVVSDVPGLYVHSKTENQWYDAEGYGHRAQATLLAGRELMRTFSPLRPTDSLLTITSFD